MTQDYLVFWHKDNEWSPLNNCSPDLEHEVQCVWVYGCKSEQEAIQKAFENRYILTGDEWHGFAIPAYMFESLNEDSLTKFSFSMNKKSVYTLDVAVQT